MDPAPQPVHVLVVDDNDDMAASMELLLRREGYSVESAPNGAVALRRHLQRRAHVVITDLLMPEKDGIETIAHFRAEFPSVRIIAMSGGGTRVRGERYLSTAAEIGADAVLKKPFEVAALLDTLRRVTNGGAR
jgi:CheY-like chemotaxis protein